MSFQAKYLIQIKFRNRVLHCDRPSKCLFVLFSLVYKQLPFYFIFRGYQATAFLFSVVKQMPFVCAFRLP